MKIDSSMNPGSAWQIRLDITFAKVVYWISRPEKLSEPQFDMHVLFYDRYWRLAVHHQNHGNSRKAQRFKSIALFHWEASHTEHPPPAGALAMPVPTPPLFTDAVARKAVKPNLGTAA